ncbi:TOMM precursor leader peptide-binding protein [Streptomyces sp. NPDC127084]|uniref:TOMM precursor leader peptide-binding protein n=1 Tax=Streptomyces sp. NPDC127084 TaxID=3347133 RepID=UPI003651049D
MKEAMSVQDDVYSEIAQTRPKLHRNVLFAKVSDGVVFHNSSKGFRIRSRSGYDFASLLVPFLNGEHRVCDLCRGLAHAQRGRVVELVQALYEHDFARAASPPDPELPALPDPVQSVFADQIGYIDHHRDGAEQAFKRFRDTRAAVLGTDAIAEWCALSLIRNGVAHVAVTPPSHDQFAQVRMEAQSLAAQGCPAQVEEIPVTAATLHWNDLEGYDVVVVCPRSGPRQVVELLRDLRPVGRMLIPVSRAGDRIVVGPLTADETTACWACAALRMDANGCLRQFGELWRRAALPDLVEPEVCLTGPAAAVLGNLLGYEVFRLRTGALPAETDGHVIVQDLNSLDVTSERVLPHPNCPFCVPTKGEAPELGAEVWGEAANLEEAEVDALHGPLQSTGYEGRLLRQFRSRSILVGRMTGVFTEFSDDALVQSPVKATLLSFGAGASGQLTVETFDVHTLLGARMRALYKAAALYADYVVPLRDVVTSPCQISSIAGNLVTVSGTHDAGTEAESWVQATSLCSGEETLVPAGAVSTHGTWNERRIWLPGAPGTGAGSTLNDALYRGLLSVIAHRAVDEALKGRRPIRLVREIPHEQSPELTFLLRCARDFDIEVELLDLGEHQHSGANVIVARANGEQPVVACETTATGAAVQAAVTLLGRAQLRRAPDAADTLPKNIWTPADVGFIPSAGETPLATQPAADLRTILRQLQSSGSDVFALSRTSADLAAAGVFTARVLLTAPHA